MKIIRKNLIGRYGRDKICADHMSSSRSNFSSLIFIISLAILVALSVLFIISVPGGAHVDDYVPPAILIIIGLLSGLFFCLEMASVGLTGWAIFLFFIFCFYGVMPFLYYRSGLWLFGDISVDNRSGILMVGGLCLAFSCAATLGRCLARVYFNKYLSGFVDGLVCREFRGGVFMFLPVMQVVAIAFIILTLGKDALLLRGAEFEAGNFQSFWVVVILNFIRPLSFFPFIAYVVISRGRWDVGRVCFSFILGVLALIGNMPTSTPRFYLFMLVTVLLYSLFYGRRSWRIVGLLFLIFGFFAGVVTDQFRALKSVSDFSDIEFKLDDYLTAGHFDAFEMNVYALDYANLYGFEKGRQALGVASFWVPRVVWPDKPVPTGVMLGSEFIGGLKSTQNTNLSCPLPAEAYIDLGALGVLLYGIIFGCFLGLLDKAISHVWLNWSQPGRPTGALIVCMMVFPVLVGMVLFLSRGSLMSAFAYTVGSFVSAMVFYISFTKKCAIINNI